MKKTETMTEEMQLVEDSQDVSFKKDDTNETKQECVYNMMFGEDEREYYTFISPIITHESIQFKNLFCKGTISEVVLELEISEHYKEESIESEKIINLTSGIFLKLYKPSELDWLDVTFGTAKERVQERTLNAYKEMMPKVLQQLSFLQERQEKIVKVKKQSDNLLDLD